MAWGAPVEGDDDERPQEQAVFFAPSRLQDWCFPEISGPGHLAIFHSS